jgi:hypothetical protein
MLLTTVGKLIEVNQNCSVVTGKRSNKAGLAIRLLAAAKAGVSPGTIQDAEVR